jgi:hypothetical protein
VKKVLLDLGPHGPRDHARPSVLVTRPSGPVATHDDMSHKARVVARRNSSGKVQHNVHKTYKTKRHECKGPNRN